MAHAREDVLFLFAGSRVGVWVVADTFHERSVGARTSKNLRCGVDHGHGKTIDEQW